MEMSPSAMPPDTRYVFHPMYNGAGKLIAFECLTRFPHLAQHGGDGVEHFFLHASAQQRHAIFLSQLAFLEDHQKWFRQRSVIVTLNVDDDTLSLLAQSEMISRVKKMGFIHFEVHENASRLFWQLQLHNLLTRHYSLWLDDFGNGVARMQMLPDYAFRFIKIDKQVFWNYWRHPTGKHQLTSLLTELQRHNFCVVIEGIETNAQRQWLGNMPFYALQGKLWCEMSMEELKNTPPILYIDSQ